MSSFSAPHTRGNAGCETIKGAARRYTVDRDDTYFSIAESHGVSIDALLEENPGVDPDTLTDGQIIHIPRSDAQKDIECPENTQPYTIRPGDNFFRLARRFGTTIDAILEVNPDIDPDQLESGMLVCIPAWDWEEDCHCPPGTMRYTVRKCDTMFRIANRHRLSLKDLLHTNPDIQHPEDIYVGQTICVPTRHT